MKDYRVTDVVLGSAMRSWRGTWKSRAAAATAGLVLMSSGLILNTSKAAAAVGDITEYPLPATANGSPTSIAQGPDGNLWFIDSSGQVAKMTTSGVVTAYPIPDP